MEKSKGKAKIKKVMKEFGKGELHSGSKKGPIVSNPKQGIAIAMSEAGMSKKKSNQCQSALHTGNRKNG